MALANCGLMGVQFVVCRLCKINQKLNPSILTSVCVHHRHMSYYQITCVVDATLNDSVAKFLTLFEFYCGLFGVARP